MQVAYEISEVRARLGEVRASGRKIAFVPTMGALHEGHLSLMRLARKHADYLVASIYVNPTQFNNKEDLAKYPRLPDADLKLCEANGVDLVFAPSDAELYPQGAEYSEAGGGACRILAGDRSAGLCGATRPGHFDGVVTVVGILFNIVQPDVAVFGEKDYQQARVIEQMVRDLHFGVQIIKAPIVREADGLALSSRNLRLSPAEREDALRISRSLNAALGLSRRGERNAETIIALVRSELAKSDRIKIDYVELVECDSLKPASLIKSQAQLLVAAFVGPVRLIDNIRLGSSGI